MRSASGRSTVLALAVLAFCILPTPPVASEEPPPRLTTLTAEGITVYKEAELPRIVRLPIGRPLYLTPEEVAARLQRRYAVSGYAAAQVSVGSWDPSAGALHLRVDEGRIAEVAIEGVEGAAAVRAEKALGIAPGEPLRVSAVRKALSRLEDASSGAYERGDPPFRHESTPAGVRLVIPVRFHRARLVPSLGGPGTAPFYNRVEGLAPGLGLRFRVHDSSSFRATDVYAKVAYGFSSKEVRHAVGIRQPLFGALTVGYDHHDLTDTDDRFRGVGIEDPEGRVLNLGSFHDYHRRTGHEAWARVDAAGGRGAATLAFRADRFRSLPVVSDGNLFGEGDEGHNPAVPEGDMRSVLLQAAFATHGPVIASSRSGEEWGPLKSLQGGRWQRTQGVRLDGSLEIADADALGGDFDLHRLIVVARGARPFSARDALLVRVAAGTGSDDLPWPRRFFLGGIGTLRGIETKSLGGDRMVLATLEYERAGVRRWPDLFAFYDGGAVASKGLPGSGWVDDVGVGLRWPAGLHSTSIRVDAAVPLGGGGGVKVTGRLIVPY